MIYPHIRELREERHLTQRKMAELLQISPGTYSRYERGAVKIPLKVACGLAEIHNTSVDYLIGITDQRVSHRQSK